MPPPLPPVLLPLITTLSSERLSPYELIAPPLPAVLPLVSVRLLMFALMIVAPIPSLMLKMRDALLPLMVMTFRPGPLIVTLSMIGISPVVSVIVPVSPDWKLTVSAPPVLFACVTASRRLPAPLSLRFVTVNVAADAEPASANAPRPARMGRRFRFDFLRSARSRARRCCLVSVNDMSQSSLEACGRRSVRNLSPNEPARAQQRDDHLRIAFSALGFSFDRQLGRGRHFIWIIDPREMFDRSSARRGVHPLHIA